MPVKWWGLGVVGLALAVRDPVLVRSGLPGTRQNPWTRPRALGLRVLLRQPGAPTERTASFVRRTARGRPEPSPSAPSVKHLWTIPIDN